VNDMKLNIQNQSPNWMLCHLTAPAYGRFLIVLALTAVLLFLFVNISESSGKKSKKKYQRFYVVSSYKKIDDAAALVDKMRAQGYDPFSKTVDIPNKGKWHRVYVKHYTNKQKALSAGKKLREKGLIKGFFILLKTDSVKTKPEDKRPTPPGNVVNKKINNTPSPILTKVETPAILVSTKKKIIPVNVVNKKIKNTAPPVLTKGETPAVPVSTKKKIIPVNVANKKIKNTAPPILTKVETPAVHVSTKEKIVASKKAPINNSGLDLEKDIKLYINAMSDFTAGRYEDALDKFKKIIKNENNETTLRRIADCYYFLGEKKDKRYFSEAITAYTQIIRNYPESKKENAQAIYRLAQSFNHFNLYSNALMEFAKFCARYPESDYFSEAFYMMGRMNYKTGNLNRAITNFKEYIKRYPDTKNFQTAYFQVGDCYSRMTQFKDADAWYGNALKRWPALEDIPEDSLLSLGSHYFQAEKYNEALEVFFVYLNLFSQGKNCSKTLYTIARSFEETGQFSQALKSFSLLIERHPRSVEAIKGAAIMAKIGVKAPKIKLPVYILSGMEYYRNPIEAYDKMMGKIFDVDREEELAFWKGCALIKKKRYQEAFDNCRLMLDRFPYGTHRKAGEKNLILSAGRLIDDYYSKKDYLCVSNIYFHSDRIALFENGNFDVLLKIGTSLEKIDLPGHAAGVFEEMIKVFVEDKRITALLLAMAKIDYDRSDYEGARKRLKELFGKPSYLDKETSMAARQLLGDICYKEGRFKEAVGFYQEVLGAKEDNAAIRKKYADSLRGMGLYPLALINYKRILKNCDDLGKKCSASLIMGSYEGLGDCLYSEGEYEKAIPMYEQSLKKPSEGEQNMWAIFNIGRGYTKLGNKPMADKSFSLLKRERDNEFWQRVMDYYTADKNWTKGLEI
jgi:TolA-binding protein